MEKLGELLKQARREKNLTLEEIGERTKIQCRYLEALEGGDVSPFAGEVYIKGALRNYAETVGLDPQEVLELYRSLREEAVQAANGQKAGEKAPAAEKSQPVERPQRARPSTPPEPGKGPSFKAGLIVLSLALVAGIIYFAYSGSKDKEQVQQPPVEQPGDQEKPADNPVATPDPAPPVAVTVKSTADGETVYSVTGAAAVEVTVQLNGRCWVQVQVDSRQTHQGTYAYGQEITVDGTRSVWVRLGYPPAARLTVNGIEIAGLREQTLPYNYNFILE